MPISGSAPTLNKATADFKRGYERMRDKTGLPKQHCPSDPALPQGTIASWREILSQYDRPDPVKL